MLDGKTHSKNLLTIDLLVVCLSLHVVCVPDWETERGTDRSGSELMHKLVFLYLTGSEAYDVPQLAT